MYKGVRCALCNMGRMAHHCSNVRLMVRKCLSGSPRRSQRRFTESALRSGVSGFVRHSARTTGASHPQVARIAPLDVPVAVRVEVQTVEVRILAGPDTFRHNLRLATINTVPDTPQPVAAATVLVVGDERGQRELLARWLDRWGYSVRLAGDASAALDAMLAHTAEILVTELQMPGHDGLWLVERVRVTWPRTEIILATGVVELERVKRARLLGAVDYVTKQIGRAHV